MLIQGDKGAIMSPLISERDYIRLLRSAGGGAGKVLSLASSLAQYFEYLTVSETRRDVGLRLGFSYWENDRDSRKGMLVAAAGFEYSDPRYPHQLHYSEGIVGAILAAYEENPSAEADVSPNLARDERLAADDFVVGTLGYKACISFKICSDGLLLGVFKLYSSSEFAMKSSISSKRLKLESDRLNLYYSLTIARSTTKLLGTLEEHFNRPDRRKAGPEGSVREVSETLSACLRFAGELLDAGEVRAELMGFSHPVCITRETGLTPNTVELTEDLRNGTGGQEAMLGKLRARGKSNDTHFSLLDRHFFRLISKEIGKYLDRSRSEHADKSRVLRQARLLERSSHLCAQIVLAVSIGDVLQVLLDGVRAEFEFSAGIILLNKIDRLVPFISSPPAIATKLIESGAAIVLPRACPIATPDWDWTKHCPECLLCGGLTGIAATKRRLLVFPNLDESPARELFTDLGVRARSEVVIPIATGDELYGVLDLYYDRIDPLDENEQYFLQALCQVADVAIRSLRLTDKVGQMQFAEARGEVARNIVHTLSPNTSSTINLVSTAKQWTEKATKATKDPAQVRGHMQQVSGILDEILNNARRLQNVLKSYGLQAKSFAEVEKDVNIHQVLDDIIRLHAFQAESKGITFRRERQGVPKVVRAMEGDIHLIFWNLINNAIKFTRGNRMSQIIITEIYGLDAVVITVKDEGVGIPERHRKQIWALDFSTPAPGAKMPTSGIGLYTVSSIAKRLKGAVDVHSIMGKGTEFSVVLPLSVS